VGLGANIGNLGDPGHANIGNLGNPGCANIGNLGDSGCANIGNSDPGPGWRIEVLGGGRWFAYRRGSGRNRQSRYGGRFDLLPEWRKRQYQQRRRRDGRASGAGGGAV
jgi:hypothetical protein